MRADDAARLADQLEECRATTPEGLMLTSIVRSIRVGPLLAPRPQTRVTSEALALAASLFFAITCNATFLRAVMADRSWADPGTWVFAGAMLTMLTAGHLVLLLLFMHRRFARPLLMALVVATAFASYYMHRYGIFLSPGMLRNVLRTNVAEARELLAWGVVPHLLVYGVLPLVLLSRVRVSQRTLMRAMVVRVASLVGAFSLLVGSVLLVFQDFSALMRNQKDLRYLVTPANYLYSAVRVLVTDTRQAVEPRAAIGTDARLSTAWAARTRPALVVIVVGETARAANWGLSGYRRQTTPELAKLDVLNFRDMSACGTDTETSLPCMFSAIGRRDYDEDRIRGSESMLHVLKRAGFDVLWRDNQSGCKGVCDGLPQLPLDAHRLPELCADGRCLDEALLRGLDAVARDAKGSLVVVLHLLGSHGPTYFKRYPEAFRRFTPTCDTGELRKCDRQQIVNTYDNTLLYTDHVLARTVAYLKEHEARFDTAMLYVSDHGESLGERGLYLHGLPYAIAPQEQTRIPMVWWLSAGFTLSTGLDRDCLVGQTGATWSHDHLFHTVLGLLQVDTRAYERGLDISAACRR